jgi:predicted transcriptional regulator
MPAITVRLDEETLRQIDDLANAMDRPSSWVVTDALARYLEEERLWLEQIREGIAQLDRGEGISHERVMDEMRRKIASHRTKATG